MEEQIIRPMVPLTKLGVVKHMGKWFLSVANVELKWLVLRFYQFECNLEPKKLKKRKEEKHGFNRQYGESRRIPSVLWSNALLRHNNCNSGVV